MSVGANPRVTQTKTHPTNFQTAGMASDPEGGVGRGGFAERGGTPPHQTETENPSKKPGNPGADVARPGLGRSDVGDLTKMPERFGSTQHRNRGTKFQCRLKTADGNLSTHYTLRCV